MFHCNMEIFFYKNSQWTWLILELNSSIDDDDDDLLMLDSSYQRASINTIHGETIRISMVVFPNSIEQNVQYISNIEIPY